MLHGQCCLMCGETTLLQQVKIDVITFSNGSESGWLKILGNLYPMTSIHAYKPQISTSFHLNDETQKYLPYCLSWGLENSTIIHFPSYLQFFKMATVSPALSFTAAPQGLHTCYSLYQAAAGQCCRHQTFTDRVDLG